MDAPPRTWKIGRPTTPFLLRLGMLAACLPVALFAAAVQLGVARNDSTVETVGRQATQGINAAQAIKLNLAELDEIVVRDLIDPPPLDAGGFPENYSLKRSELHDNLVLVAAEASAEAAYRQPLVNIDYVLGHYHSLVREAFAARAAGDMAQATTRYAQAHDVMEQTLLSEADFVDKANTYVLEDTYDRQTARSASTVRLMVVSWAVLLGSLLVAQLLLARRFRRLLNVSLLAATLLVVATGGFALFRLDRSSSELTTAREQSFDAVHVLARARAAVVSARQSEGHLLLDPGRASRASTTFAARASQLFRVPGGADVTSVARSGEVPEGAGGYLATVAAVTGEGGEGEQSSRAEVARRALVAFGEFMASDTTLRQLVAGGDDDVALARYDQVDAFADLTDAVDDARFVNQAAFDRHADAAADAAAYVGPITAVAAGGVLVLVLVGLYLRLREYGT